MLYSSVPYDKDETKCIKTVIMSRIKRQRNGCYYITMLDVINAATYFKVDTSDGSEGLCTDHFINSNKHLYVFVSLLITLFLVHGFSPASMILGTVISIPKDKKK